MKKILHLVLIAILASQSYAQTITTVAGGNGAGSAANQFDGPSGIFLDNNGNIYISDYSNNRIQKFSAGSTSASSGMTVAGSNGSGNSLNQINPEGIYIDASGNLFVADNSNNRILEFPAGSSSSTNGIIVAGGNGQGNAANQLNYPSAVTLDTIGNIYVADADNGRVQMFPSGSSSSTNGVTVAKLGTPSGIIVDRNSNIYVSDGDNSILKFPAGSTASTQGDTVAGGNGQGNAANQLNLYFGRLFLDLNGNIYVADANNNRIQKFSSGSTSATNGVTVAGGNGSGTNPNQLNSPTDVYVDGNGNIFIADAGNNRIQKWTQPTGISTIPSLTTISIYPNPNSGSFILQSNGSIGKEYTVYDMIGRVMAQGTITADKQNIDLKGIAMGSYTLEVQGSKAIRFVIEN
jgi:sugar lactone lactonase YvrE